MRLLLVTSTSWHAERTAAMSWWPRRRPGRCDNLPIGKTVVHGAEPQDDLVAITCGGVGLTFARLSTNAGA
jgi:hypothetical protein